MKCQTTLKTAMKTLGRRTAVNAAEKPKKLKTGTGGLYGVASMGNRPGILILLEMLNSENNEIKTKAMELLSKP